MHALPALQIENLGRYANGEREARIVCALASVYPKAITGKQLMIRSGLPFHSCPFTAFVELCNSFIRINRILPSYGWQAVRSGGGPRDFYRLSLSGG